MTTAGCLSDEAFAAWVTTELSVAERDRAIEHAASCDRCRAVVAHLFGGGAAGPMRIGRYELVEPLGAGGMGVVFRGRDTVLGREVAIKMIRANLVEPAHRERMLREAQAMAKISHPNVVTVHELGDAGDEVFVAMELVTGTILPRWLASPRTDAERIAVTLGIGRGIAAVHAAGLLHRDIKPDNIVIRDDGTPVLVDFGLAHIAGTATLGHGSARAGTPHYLAPEILAGAAASAASDQYQWWTVAEQILGERTRARPVARVIARGHDRDPASRFPAMADALAALERALGRRRSLARHLALLAAAGVLAAAAGGYVISSRGGAGASTCDPASPAGWSAGRRASIERSLRAANVEPARVLAALDARVATTSALRAKACTETARRGSPRAEWTRRLVCLDETWARARAALAELEHADAARVREGIDELSEVMPAERCTRGSLPAIPERLAPDRDQRYRALVQRIQDLEQDTRLPTTERTTRLRALEAEVVALEYPPLDARWHWAIGHTLSDARDTVGAARELGRSAEAALAAGDDDTYVRALISQLHVTSTAASDDQVAALEQQAIAGARRLGNPQIEAQLFVARAKLQMERGSNAQARPLFEQADRLYSELSLGAHAMHVGMLQNLGSVCLELGDLAAAEGYLDRTVELARRRYTETGAPYWEARAARAVAYLARGAYDRAEPELRAAAVGLAAAGPVGGQLGMLRAYLCALVLERGDLVLARTECAAAVAATQAALGPDSPGQVWALTLSGQVEVQAGAPARALELLRRAVALAEAGHVRPIEATIARAHLAIALRAANQPRAARTLARQVAPALAAVELAETRADFLVAFPELAALASPR